MTKAGIVTFYNHDNYGAVLQAYALQRTIELLGCEAYHIEFETAQKNSKPQKVLIPMLAKLYDESDKRAELFASFRADYLKIQNLSQELITETDVFIAGSDQVWNPEITGGNGRFLLGFAPKEKRVSYAASFGKALSETEMNLYSEGISELRYVSVREKSAADTVRKLSQREAIVCADPVFLLTKTEWEKLITCNAEETPYMLLIMVQNDKKLLEEAQKEAEKRGLCLKVITAAYFPLVGFPSWSGNSVNEWLRLIHDAEYVITSSFHGLAFSLLFEREYRVASLQGELTERNSRLDELLQLYQIAPFGQGSKAREHIENERTGSLDYLRRVLKCQK